METLEKITTIGGFVAKDFRTASVFSKYGIDFCWKGNKTIEEVCKAKRINPNILEQEIATVLGSKNESVIDFNSWPLDLLADYIEKKHHTYVNENAVVLLRFLKSAGKTYGDNNPQLVVIYELFKECVQEMTAHMKNEELVLFPFIKKIVNAAIVDEVIELSDFKNFESPVDMMLHEHDIEGERFRKIAELSNNYTPPANSCNVLKITYAMLKEFEEDLHKHIHLENNILFPKAIQLEKDYSAQF